jgi:hypothetical protein
MLMVSMAVSDIGLLTLLTWMYGVVIMMTNWKLEMFLCKLQSFATHVSGDSSMWAVAIVSIDR